MRLTAALLAGALALAGAACGVEVPDDVAARVDASTTTTEAGPGPTTAPPTSDDPLEQALLDNGYSPEEARCGAERLRDVLDEDEVREVVEAASLEDIDAGTARRLTDALRQCVDGAADGDDDDDDGGGDRSDPGDPGRRGGPRRPPGG